MKSDVESYSVKNRNYYFKIFKKLILPIFLGLTFFIVIMTLLSKNPIFIFTKDKNYDGENLKVKL